MKSLAGAWVCECWVAHELVDCVGDGGPWRQTLRRVAVRAKSALESVNRRSPPLGVHRVREGEDGVNRRLDQLLETDALLSAETDAASEASHVFLA